MRCPQCGAEYTGDTESCESRWHTLLALDHSRKAPWGPLHGLAFSTWSLQHSANSTGAARARWFDALTRIVERGEEPARVFQFFRDNPHIPVGADPTSGRPTPTRFAVTILDLGDFAGATYEENLRRWARATLDAWAVQA